MAAQAQQAESGAARVYVAVRVRPKLESLGEKFDMELIRKMDDETMLAVGYTQGIVDGLHYNGPAVNSVS